MPILGNQSPIFGIGKKVRFATGRFATGSYATGLVCPAGGGEDAGGIGVVGNGKDEQTSREGVLLDHGQGVIGTKDHAGGSQGVGTHT